MELDVTDFFNATNPADYSASAAELGDNAESITWHAACAAALDYPLIPDDDTHDAVRDHFAGFGAWTDAELRAMTRQHLTALLIQFISGDMREGHVDRNSTEDHWLDYQDRAQSGQCSGNLYRSDDHRIFFYCVGG